MIPTGIQLGSLRDAKRERMLNIIGNRLRYLLGLVLVNCKIVKPEASQVRVNQSKAQPKGVRGNQFDFAIEFH